MFYLTWLCLLKSYKQILKNHYAGLTIIGSFKKHLENIRQFFKN